MCSNTCRGSGFLPLPQLRWLYLHLIFWGTVYETLSTHVPQDQVELRMLVILTYRVLALIDYGLFDVDQILYGLY